MTQLERAQTNDECPVCGHYAHEGRGVDFEGESIKAKWSCMKCNAFFTQDFKLVGCKMDVDVPHIIIEEEDDA